MQRNSPGAAHDGGPVVLRPFSLNSAPVNSRIWGVAPGVIFYCFASVGRIYTLEHICALLQSCS